MMNEIFVFKKIMQLLSVALLTIFPCLFGINANWDVTFDDGLGSNDERTKYYEYYKQTQNGMTDEQLLAKHIFKDYQSGVRPVRNFSDPITIRMSMAITQIFELDEQNQVLVINAWTLYEWFDEYLRWQPKQFSNLEALRIPSNKIWRPDIVLYNSAADFGTMGITTQASLYFNGYVYYSVPNKFFSSCKIDVTYFPFDEQVCRMKFGSWTYDGFKVDLMNASTAVDLSVYVRNGEWDLIYAEEKRNVVYYTCCVEPYPDITFHICIRRKPLYYMINIFFPCFILSSLALLVFLLPVESGEKCGFGIAIMLGFAVFLLNVTKKLPETSDSFPLIRQRGFWSPYSFLLLIETGIYVAGALTLMATTICCTVGVLCVSYQTKQKQSKFAVHVYRFFQRIASLFRYFCRSSNNHETTKSGDEDNVRKLRLFMNELSLISSGRDETISAVTDGVQRLAERLVDEMETKVAMDRWRTLAQYLDNFLFAILLTISIIFSSYIVIFAPAFHLL